MKIYGTIIRLLKFNKKIPVVSCVNTPTLIYRTMNQKGQTCSCPHHKMGAMFLLLSGVLLLLGSLGVLTTDTMLMSWSIVLILLGLAKMFRCHCC